MSTKAYRLGEKRIQNNGLLTEIIDYPRGSDMTVRFEDGKRFTMLVTTILSEGR